jgi:hypothetical protein
LERYKSIIDDVNFKDINSITLIAGAKSSFKWYYVRDPSVAKELDLKPGVVYRYRDPRGLFDCRVPKQMYTTNDAIRDYIEDELESNYSVNGHRL